jgi:hypothetical protein
MPARLDEIINRQLNQIENRRTREDSKVILASGKLFVVCRLKAGCFLSNEKEICFRPTNAARAHGV